MSERQRPAPQKKRMVICMDGTGNNCIGTDQPQTNVVRLGRCTADVGFDGVPQQVYYHYGIGNSVDWLVNTAFEQATGAGWFAFSSVMSTYETEN